MKTSTIRGLKAGGAPLAMGLALIAGPAFAQEAATPASTADAPATDIVVTGSLIKNPNLVSANPVTVTSSNEIELKQSNTAEEALRDIPGFVPNLGSAVNNGTNGGSYVDLRGLGSNRNVVLLDGNRIVPSSLTGAVDLNNIPLALVSRVDALTGAAVTTYGADAITGVVNFITKKDFSGVDLSLSDRINQRGDGMYKRADLTIGSNFADDRGNAVISLGYQKSDAVYQGDRDYAYTAIDSFYGSPSGSGTMTPTRFSFPGAGSANHIDPATGKIVKGTIPFNFNPYNLFQTPFKRYNIFAQANYKVSDAIELYSRGMFSKNEVVSVLAPAGSFGTTVEIPYSNPYLPVGVRNQFCSGSLSGIYTASSPLTPTQCAAAAAANSPSDPNYRTFTTTIRRRMTEAGTRDYTYDTTVFDMLFGAKGKITNSIDWDVHGSYGESQNDQTVTGYIRTSRLKDALLATGTGCISGNAGCVPLNIFGPDGSITQSMLSYLEADQKTTVKTSLAQFHGQISGDTGFTSPAAGTPVSFAIGTEYRKYTASQDADVLSQIPGEFSGTSGSTPVFKGGYHVWEGFAELVAPLVEDKPGFQSLTAEGGVRYSKYNVNGAGSTKTWTWKGGLTWEPVPDLKFRGNYARAVRAPNINELFLPVTTQLTNLAQDPCAGSAPLANANLKAICLAQGAPASVIGQINNPSGGQANYYGGGNLNLKPEKATTYTIGMVLTPHQIRRFSISVDYYHIKVNDVIGSPVPGDAINACFGDITAASAASAACTAIRRDPATGGLDGDPSTTPGLPLTLTNLGRLATSGIDFTLNYQHDFGAVKWALAVAGNYTFHQKYNSNPADPAAIDRECVGYYSVNCGFTGSLVPRFQSSVRNTLTYGKWDASLNWRHLSGFQQEPLDAESLAAFVGTLPAGLGSLTGQNVDFGHIKPYDMFDLTLRWNVNENFTFSASVQNMFDKDPPLVGYDIGNTAFNSGNTYPSTYDALGRRFAVSARIKY